MEAAELAIFMISASLFTVLLYHPASPAVRAIPQEFMRRALTGLAMGLTLIGLVYSPWGKRSGAHMNPVVTLTAACVGGLEWKIVPTYIAAQIGGAIAGVWIAHGMFDLPLLEISTHVRTGTGQWLAETVATTGLLGVVWGCLKYETPTAAAAVAAYIGGAYWFTASTSFANPAVTIARSLTDTFAGIRPVDVPGFIGAQIAALGIAVLVLRRAGKSRQVIEAGS